MAFKIKCESCGSTIHKVWDTPSFYQPNTHSGFSATLFQNKESKEYNLAIISTESKRAV